MIEYNNVVASFRSHVTGFLSCNENFRITFLETFRDTIQYKLYHHAV